MWTALCRWLLIIFNIILALLCAGIIVFAGFLLHGGSVVRQLWYLGMNWLMHDLKEDVPKYLSGLEDLLKISTVNTAIGMIVAASLLLIISVVGIFAAIFAHKRTLISYTIIVTVLALGHVAAVVWFDLDQFKTGGFLGRLVRSWMEAFASEERGMPEDRMAALLMQKLRCCGYQNGSDFQKSKAFTKRDTVAGIPMTGKSSSNAVKRTDELDSFGNPTESSTDIRRRSVARN
ncbi:unnamed protein product [Dicrocoelium dendriticum]|nr:unnamed protein product [Dicrocoelium dendriticum]